MADIDHWLSSSNERRARFEAIAAEIFEPLQRYIRRRIEPNDAEDVFADVLLTVWRRLDDAPEGQILPWSYGVARRTLANRRRARSRHLRLLRRLELEPHDRFVPPPTERARPGAGRGARLPLPGRSRGAAALGMGATRAT